MSYLICFTLKKLDELAINFLPIQEHKPNSHLRKLPSLEEPDVSMIQKVSQVNQLEEPDDSFGQC